MKGPILASALTLLLGSGMALANTTDTSKSDMSKDKDTSMEKSKDTSASDMNKEVQNVNLFFDTDSSTLNESANADLKTLADWAKCHSSNAIILEGFADPRGTQDHNVKLSAARAASVRQALLDLGVPSKRIVVSVYGENGPKRKSNQEARRVTAKAATTPIAPEDLSG